ncbi:hypothetical protein TBK1r_62270 [Stieleria magnilauensis]|uniref:RING-type domain-containing protein n=1 Tax=Stieleria magnilauensis TaxID=2527963 RepID=A0ABX5XYT1_9BACT|nr:hypothetical protein TBK1r_62270 [Planctomycetes bacterium TBK1r]
MVAQSDIESKAAIYCPKCRSPTSTQIVYGFPLQEDLPPRCVYGGDECPTHAPTQFCDRCDFAWRLADSQPLCFAFPRKCYFCSQSLNVDDKLSYSMEFERWISNDRSGLNLTDDTFSQSLYPVCGQCRESIRGNIGDLLDQERLEERDRVFAVRYWFAGIVFFILVFYFATLVKN